MIADDYIKQALFQFKQQEESLLLKIQETSDVLEKYQKEYKIIKRKITAVNFALKDDDNIPFMLATTSKGVREAIFDILLVAKRLHYADIYKQLFKRGVQIKGKNPKQNLISYLSRDERFIRTGKGFYELTNEVHYE